MSHRKSTLGSEHPCCDSIQLAMLILYFAVWIIDSLSYFIFRISTVLIEITSFPLLLLPTVLALSLGIYLTWSSHEAVFGRTRTPGLINSGVYSWVRHPMYLGILITCLGFFFIMPSLLSLGVWVAFFIFYDKMATYEERDLIRTIGEEYVDYQKRVSKWGLKL